MHLFIHSFIHSFAHSFNADGSNNHVRTFASSVVVCKIESFATETEIAAFRVITYLITSSIILKTLISICNTHSTWTRSHQRRSLTICTPVRVSKKLCKIIFVRTLSKSTNCENFWHKDGKADMFRWGALIFQLTEFVSIKYHVKRRCSKLLHNAVIVCSKLVQSRYLAASN